MASLSDLLVTLKGDASGFRAEMQSARQTATGTTLSIVRSFEQVEAKARETNRSAKAVAKGISSIGGEMSGAAGSAVKFGSSLLSALAAGPIVAATTAIGIGVGALITKYQEASAAAEASARKQVEENNKVKESIDKIVQSIAAQVKAQQLALFGSDVGTSDMIDQWETHNAAVGKAAAAYEKARKEWLHWHEAAKADTSGTSERLRDRAEAPMRAAERALTAAKAEQAEFGAKLAEFTKGQKDIEEIQGLLDEQKALDKPTKVAAAGKVGGDSGLQAELRSYDLLIERARIFGDRQDEITQREKRALAELSAKRDEYSAKEYALARSNIIETAYAQRAELAKTKAREQADYELAQQARVAQGTATRTDDLRVQRDQEIEAVRRKVEDEVIAEEEGQRRILEIRERYAGATLRAVAAEAEARQAEIDRAVLDQDRLAGQALQAGAAAGTSLIQGMRQAIESGDAAGIAKGILGAAAGILTAFGGPLGAGIGQGLSMFAGMFAEGGIIDGLTGDRNLVLAADGEGILKQSSMQKIGAPFFHRLNEDGVVDLSLLRKYASGGMVGRDASPAVVSSGGDGGRTEIHIRSFDSVDALGGLRRVLGPATVYRNSLRQAEVERQSMSRWVR